MELAPARRLSRRTILTAAIGSFASAVALVAAGIRPRFRNGFSFRGAAKSVTGVSAGDFARSGSLSFLVIGDWGSGLAQQHEVAVGMQTFASRMHPKFVVSTGDNIYPSGVTSIHDPLWNSRFEQVYTGPQLQIPWFAALGNHDHKGAIDPQCQYHSINSRWNLPSPYYTFRQQADGVTADFFVLDTEAFDLGDDESISEQTAWLDDQLSRSLADWKIVVGHHPIRSNGHYGSNPSLIREIKPLLDRYGVAAYLCGHDHDLQLLKADDDRFVCVVSGAGGKARDAKFGEHSLFAGTNGGFAALSLTHTEMSVAFCDPAGDVVHVERCLRMHDETPLTAR